MMQDPYDACPPQVAELLQIEMIVTVSTTR